MPAAFEVRRAAPSDFSVLIDHYLALWDSYGVPRTHHLGESRDEVDAFLKEGLTRYEFAAFVCEHANTVIASACCQVRRSPYPEVLLASQRKIGYIWSVYIEDQHQGRGLGTALTRRCIDHLRSIGCTSVILHSSYAGLPLYRKLGFSETHELSLDLRTK